MWPTDQSAPPEGKILEESFFWIAKHAETDALRGLELGVGSGPPGSLFSHSRHLLAHLFLPFFGPIPENRSGGDPVAVRDRPIAPVTCDATCDVSAAAALGVSCSVI